MLTVLCILSEEGAAMLDILSPPYGDTRPCTYYQVRQDFENSAPGCQCKNVQVTGSKAQGAAVELVPTHPSDDFYVNHSPYAGLKIESLE